MVFRGNSFSACNLGYEPMKAYSMPPVSPKAKPWDVVDWIRVYHIVCKAYEEGNCPDAYEVKKKIERMFDEGTPSSSQVPTDAVSVSSGWGK